MNLPEDIKAAKSVAENGQQMNSLGEVINHAKVEEYEDAMVRKLSERITVYDDYFTVEFKSGIEIDVQL